MELAARFKTVFRNFPHLSVIPVSDEITERAAWLRSQYRLKTPDALQIATAFVSRAQVLLTIDEDLLEFEEIQVQVLKNFLPSRSWAIVHRSSFIALAVSLSSTPWAESLFAVLPDAPRFRRRVSWPSPASAGLSHFRPQFGFFVRSILPTHPPFCAMIPNDGR